MRILLIEDDKLLGDGIATSLKLGGFTVDWVESGEHALHALACEHFDLCILDIGLPGMSGFDVLKSLRADHNLIPVLVLTARDQIADRVKGLDYGADDYLLKPFDVEELKARIRALARRNQGSALPDIQIGELHIDPSSKVVTRGGETINLTPKEYTLLHELALHRGRVMSKEQLSELVYGWSEDVDSNAIEVHIHNLRKKLKGNIIETVRGFGYKIT